MDNEMVNNKKLIECSKKLAKLELELNNNFSLYLETGTKPQKIDGLYCYVVVKLPISDKPFCYISNYFYIDKGDKVLVYTGNGTNRFITEVIDVYLCEPYDVPFPIKDTKLVKQVFDKKADITEINELRKIVNTRPPIKGIKSLDWF